MPFRLHPLPYHPSALEPHFDAAWIESQRRRQEVFVERLNALLAGTEWADAHVEAEGRRDFLYQRLALDLLAALVRAPPLDVHQPAEHLAERDRLGLIEQPRTPTRSDRDVEGLELLDNLPVRRP